GKIGDSSKILSLDTNHPNVTALLRYCIRCCGVLNMYSDYVKRCEDFLKAAEQPQKDNRIIASSTPSHETVAYSTIAQILAFKEDAYKFRTRVQVVGYIPSVLRNFTRPYCQECRKW